MFHASHHQITVLDFDSLSIIQFNDIINIMHKIQYTSHLSTPHHLIGDGGACGW